MHHPYQTISIASPGGSPETSFLLAASGSKLLSINLSDGTIAAQWLAELSEANGDEVEQEPSEERPIKKRKLDTAERPNVTKLVVAPSPKHAVLVTGEDKCVRVFSISSEGALEQLNQRCMPKRPCAIAMMPDGVSILAADKFGDVYALPLLPTLEEDEAARQAAKPPPKASAPAATQLTVHSKANLRALENQLKQGKATQPIKGMEPLLFAHELLLGHVSMLTDVAVAELPPLNGQQKPRRYILTSDRDEHIRVSRGPPQAHIIEGFCLGHREFVTKLCLLRPDLLVSGGGDGDLYVWDWLKGKIIFKINLQSAVMEVVKGRKGADSANVPPKDLEITVSGIWLFPGSSQEKSKILVACGGIPAIFHCPVWTIQSESKQAKLEALPLPGNPLDVAIIDDILIVSIDNIHEAGTTTMVDASTEFKSRLQAFSLDTVLSSVDEKVRHLNHLLVEANEMMTVEWHEKSLQALLYGAENLRKRSGEA